MAVKNKAVAQGETVTYVNRKGYPRMAFVTLTPAEVVPGHSLTLEEGQLNLAVLNTNNMGFKHNVPSKELFDASVAQAAEAHDPEYGEFEAPKGGYWFK